MEVTNLWSTVNTLRDDNPTEMIKIASSQDFANIPPRIIFQR